MGAAVAALTVLGFVLRIAGLHQSPAGDELFTLAIVRDGPGGVLAGVHAWELNPPLFYWLASITSLAGDHETWSRVPSLLFGTAAIPVVYLLGRRTIGAVGAAIGAALLALDPFAIFYATEARGYAMLLFLSALSTLLLLRALRLGRWWWVPYALCGAAMLYTQYTGILVLAAQGLWAIAVHRDRLAPLLLANAGIALAFLPWVPSALAQSDDNQPIISAPVTVAAVGRAATQTVAGHPFLELHDLPGRAALLVAAAALLIAAIDGVRRARGRGEAPRPEAILLIALAVVAPLAVFAYSKAIRDILLPRNLTVSIPAAMLIAGAILASARGAIRVLAVGAVLAVLAVGAAGVAFDAADARPDARGAARAIDQRARSGDVVVDASTLGLGRANTPVKGGLTRYLHGPYRVEPAQALVQTLAQAARGQRVFVVFPRVAGLATSQVDASARFRLVYRRVLPGFTPLEIRELQRI